jgi:hypothetical protein
LREENQKGIAKLDDQRSTGASEQWQSVWMVICVTMLVGLGLTGLFDVIRTLITGQTLGLVRIGQVMLVAFAIGVIFAGIRHNPTYFVRGRRGRYGRII